jgi:DNA-binding NarL/FixJ family response regulator
MRGWSDHQRVRRGCAWRFGIARRVGRRSPWPDLASSRIGSGGSAIDPIVIEHLMKRAGDETPLTALTKRERDVMACMAEGRSNHSIGQTLHITEKTVEACTGRIFAKLGLVPGPDDHRRVRAVLTYLDAANLSNPP